MASKFFDKKASSGGGVTLANKSAVKNENMSNKDFLEELHEPIFNKFISTITFKRKEKYNHFL